MLATLYFVLIVVASAAFIISIIIIQKLPTPTATASTHSSRIVVSACTVPIQSVALDKFPKKSHLVRLPPLRHNKRLQFEQQGCHLLKPVGVFSLKVGFRSYHCKDAFHFCQLHCSVDIPGLHDHQPHRGQYRQVVQVSWPGVQVVARVSLPSSQARLAF